MLYSAGEIRKIGRVDHGDAFLDSHEIERDKGITIFSKQAVMRFRDTEFTLLDTPGHVDFSTEMERTLSVLDYAILVISGTDGIQNHTETLWRLLARYNVPVSYTHLKAKMKTQSFLPTVILTLKLMKKFYYSFQEMTATLQPMKTIMF